MTFPIGWIQEDVISTIGAFWTLSISASLLLQMLWKSVFRLLTNFRSDAQESYVKIWFIRDSLGVTTFDTGVLYEYGSIDAWL